MNQPIRSYAIPLANFAQTYTISLEGAVVAANFNSGAAGTWRKLGPYPVTISDGAITVFSLGGHVNFSGIEIWQMNQGQSSARMAFDEDMQEEILVEEVSDELELLVYPNPASGILNIEFTTRQSGVTQLAIFNTRGEVMQVLYDSVVPAGRHENLEVEPFEWVNGVYIVQLVNGDHVKYFKLAFAR